LIEEQLKEQTMGLKVLNTTHMEENESRRMFNNASSSETRQFMVYKRKNMSDIEEIMSESIYYEISSRKTTTAISSQPIFRVQNIGEVS